MRKTISALLVIGVSGSNLALGVGAAEALSKKYNHCVYNGSSKRGCNHGTWWQDGSSRLVYDRAYWNYVSGPNSVYHEARFDRIPGENDYRRSKNNKERRSYTARYQFAPARGGWIRQDWEITATICEDESFSPDNCRTTGNKLAGRP